MLKDLLGLMALELDCVLFPDNVGSLSSKHLGHGRAVVKCVPGHHTANTLVKSRSSANRGLGYQVYLEDAGPDFGPLF